MKAKQQPTMLQKKAFKLLIENPNVAKSKLLEAAGYAAGKKGVNSTQILATEGFKTLQAEYNFHLNQQGVDAQLLAAKMRAGLDGEDKKTSVLEYIKETKRDIGISKEVPDTMIQINLSGELKEFAK